MSNTPEFDCESKSRAGSKPHILDVIKYRVVTISSSAGSCGLAASGVPATVTTAAHVIDFDAGNAASTLMTGE